ncbi:unnamed protein product [Zymoseptoria tritici ST99CH_1A5]|uniref:Uncharacterized protein n=1 Tax=Zymoseptoria tritici ST99CH_1A5 TaxID=1276529 RepID=A0A1Y6LRG4_ZYMTR|nr:unnamed protein product [Zymoseptoria tritici ST99CH_1A5]
MSSATHKSDKPLPTIPIVHIEPLDDENGTNDTAKPAKPWRPVTLRWPYLSVLILITVGLIATIQCLLYTSNRDQGIIFAKDINDLPLRRSFSYMYLPTIISVIYSFLWTWVDLDIKRLEPWFQLSKDGGASASDSILLNYPLEFLVTLPFAAFKKKHWSVLSASLVMILIFWGLTPTQAGIFATRTVTVQKDVPGSYSTAYTPIEQQGNLTAIYAQSVYNIAWLNETLPPFMTRDFVLGAFGPSKPATAEAKNLTYTGTTTLYSVDVTCREAVLWMEPSAGVVRYNGSEGCSFYAPPFRPSGGNDTSKPFDTMYVGYQNENGFADYYLSYDCDESFLHSFFIRWSRCNADFIQSGKAAQAVDPTQAEATSLFCESTYYQQKVIATISLPANTVLNASPVGDKMPLPNDLFNTSTFEWAMSSGMAEFPVRGDFPTKGFPDSKSRLIDMPLNLAYIPKMAPFAIGTYQKPVESYLDPENLRLSYQSAYRLLFSRQLVDILGRGGDESDAKGRSRFQVQAVVVVPVFAYIATALLMIILILMLGLLVAIPRRKNKLRYDPGTIGDIMDVLGDSATSNIFAPHDTTTANDLSKALCGQSFMLVNPDANGQKCEIRVRKQPQAHDCPQHSSQQPSVDIDESEPVKGIRPTEMNTLVGILFLAVQLGAIITFLVLFLKAKMDDGLPLPSQSTFVRQLVQNYIPIALATAIEPLWLVLNRFLGLLQPFDELRKGNAPSRKSVELDYSSLPPQLLFGRAMKAGHYLLAIVCFMVLLANVLAVALSGLMHEGSANVTTSGDLLTTKAPMFRLLNGTGLPFNTDEAHNSQGGTTSEPFYREMSNLTAGTPMPSWTTDQYAFLPLEIGAMNETASANVQTTAFGAVLDCEQMQTTGAQNYSLKFSPTGLDAFLSVFLEQEDGTIVNCTDFGKWSGDRLQDLTDPQPGRVALELGAMLASNKSVSEDLFCRQHILAGWLRVDWKTIEGEVRSGPGLSYYSDRNMTIVSRNETMLLCRPQLQVSPATVAVDSTGRVKKVVSLSNQSTELQSYFTTTPSDLIAQANQFLADNGGTWHKDAYPSDFLNYLIRTSTNDTTLLDASLPIPSPEHAAEQISKIYSKLFALLIGTNTGLLFEDAEIKDRVPVLLTTPHTRILISLPAFIVTEAILLFYVFTTCLFYARRPWRILPRLPSTVASIIAYFAASRSLQEVAGQSRSRAETKQARSTWKWGYGSFIGSDGRKHTGIEREPLIRPLKKGALLSRSQKW